ncbi:MAG: FAD:protein FMN transferase [Candidatus Binatia bacterium]
MSPDRLRSTLPTRREALRILAVSGAAAAAWAVGRHGAGAAEPVTLTRPMMGTSLSLTVVGTDRAAARAAALAMIAEMEALEALLSAYRPDSQVSRLNATGHLDAPAPVLLDVLRLAARVSALGDGAFDLTVQPILALYDTAWGAPPPPPAAVEAARERVDQRAVLVADDRVAFARSGMAITVDGIATGLIIDRGIAAIRAQGFDNVLVDVGGDIMLSGEHAAGVPWRVGIRNPRPGVALLARFEASNRAVATSGDYMHPFTPDLAQHHIVDPRTGYSPTELASSTIVARDAATADALSTLTLVLGARRACDLLASLPGCEGYFVAKDGTVTRTSGFVLV